MERNQTMSGTTDGKRILLLGVYGMEMVECGGVLHKNAMAGGVSHASILFAGPRMREGLEKQLHIFIAVSNILEWIQEIFLHQKKRKLH
jgi:hypothetical protein